MVEKVRILNILHGIVNFSSFQHKIKHQDSDIFRYICGVFVIMSGNLF